MRIIGFSNAAPASALPFWITPVQALGPWLSRIRNSLEDSLGNGADLPPVQREVREEIAQEVAQEVQGKVTPVRRETDAPSPFTPGTAASNDPVFDALPKPYERLSTTPPPARHSHALRVVRESDAALKADCAGRMVMSGNIDDICAELDRMAQRAARAEG